MGVPVSAPALHVVFGAGQIGPRVASVLRAQGHDARLVRRAGSAPAGIPVLHGDAGDPAFATEVTRGGAAIYHCMNPTYDSRVWAAELPRLMDALIAAAGRNGGRLVVLDNVYLLGRPAGAALSERSPIAPCSRKGEIRARVHQQLVAAGERGDVRWTMGRASDFYGPGGTGTYFGDAFWPGALGKGVAQSLIELDTPHTYHCTDDVAHALAQLGTAPDDVTQRWWMLPCAPADTSRAMVRRLGEALGRELRIQPMPRVLLSLLALFVPVLKEIGEMSYQWDEAFVVDDAAWRGRFGAETRVTPLDDGAKAMVAWAKQHYAAKR